MSASTSALTSAAASAPVTAATSAPVTAPVAIGALDLAALLCSRVCHDLISPVGAIINGLEVMEEDKDEETKTFALDLIKRSAGQASAKLQFCRLAFGAAGSAGAQIELGDAEKAVRGLFEDGKTTIVWQLARELVAKNRAKLLLNMLLVAAGAIPRGGTLNVEAVDGGYRVNASGQNARLAPAVADLLAGSPAQAVDAHTIQPLYTGILARDCGLRVSAALEGDAVVLVAR
jgi:histidine phosphotransferase ChpT